MSEQQRQMKSGSFSQYLDLREAYVEELREHELLNDRGGLRPEILDGLANGGRSPFIPVEGSPLDEHCREHPDDIVCQLASGGKKLETFLDVRGRFLDSVAEHGLGDIQRFVADLNRRRAADGVPEPMPFDAAGAGSVGLLGPDQDPDDFPPWLRPYISPVRFDGRPQPLPLDVRTRWMGGAGIGGVGLIGPDQDPDDFPPWLGPYIDPGRLQGVSRLTSRIRELAQYENALLY